MFIFNAKIYFNAKTQRRKGGAYAHTEARKGMTAVMRYAFRVFACFRMCVCPLCVGGHWWGTAQCQWSSFSLSCNRFAICYSKKMCF